MAATAATDGGLKTGSSERRLSASMMLRAASVISLILAAGHTLGGLQSWSPPGETDVLRAMRSFRFDAEGVSRTYWDFYVGFGLIISLNLLTQAVILWQLSTASKREPASVRPMLRVFFISVVANMMLTWKFFFAVPLILSVAIALSLGLALVAASARPVER
jgi:hypothetical protein